MRIPVEPEMVTRAADFVATTLGPVADRDWSVPAGEVTWSCHYTADHISDALLSYAGQVATRAPDGWVPLLRPDTWPSAAPQQLLDALAPCAAVFAEVARAAPPDARAFHSFGMSDAEGFCAMACDEILVHGGDIAQTFAVEWQPPSDIAQATLTRVFPEVGDDGDPWQLLWWANGRRELPGRERRTRWRWHAEPLT